MTVKLHKSSGDVISVNAVPIVPIPAEEGDVSVELVFTDIEGAPGGTDRSYLNGAYAKDVTEQANLLKKAMKGAHVKGKFTLNVQDVSLEDLFMTCDSDGLHNYGSERESVEVSILSGFLESDKFGLGSGQSLCLE
jgi:hypothetical protein